MTALAVAKPAETVNDRLNRLEAAFTMVYPGWEHGEEHLAADRADPDVGVESLRSVLDVLVGLRRERGLTQRGVAALMGTTQSAVSEMERGIAQPRLSTLARYAWAVGRRLRVEVVSS